MSVLSFDECALSMILIFLLGILVYKEYRTRTNKIMLAMVIMIFLALIGDLVSGHNSNMHDPTPVRVAVTTAANYLYFFCHNLIMPLYLMYVYSSIDIWHVFVGRKANIRFCVLLVAIDVVVLALNGWALDVFSINAAGEFVRGPWETVFYVVASAFAVWAFSSLIYYRRFINPDKQLVLLLLYAVVVGSIALQLFHMYLLTEGFGMAIAFMIFLVAVKREESQIDPITGAIKYHEGLHRVTRALEAKEPVSIIFIKITNGDRLRMYLGVKGYYSFLKRVTDELGGIARTNGYRGDLFYMENGLFAFLGETVDEKTVSAVAEACRDMFMESISIDQHNVMTDTAICVAFCPNDTKDIAEVLKLGTTFHLTISAVRKVCYYRDYKDNREFKIKNEIDSIIKRAVESNGLQVFYQPIYSVAEKKYVALEALVRLKDKNYGYISPSDFITEAEQNGMIHDIGEFVLNEVVRFIGKTDMNSLGLEYVIVNLSETECMEPGLADRVKNVLEAGRVPSELLAFEIQESDNAINPEIVDNNLRSLRNAGSKIVLGGYGSGYSDMRRMVHMPIDQIKLDRNLVSLTEDPKMWEVISSTIKSIMEMGKEVRIVGIENEEAARKYNDLEASLIQGCSFVQGFFYCRPVTAEEAVGVIMRYME